MAETTKIVLSETEATQIFTSSEDGVATVGGSALFFISDEASPAIPTDGAAHFRSTGSIVESIKQNVFAYKQKGASFAEVIVSKWS